MSKRVLFTCTLLLLLGVAGMLQMAASIRRGSFTPDVMVLFLPASICLALAIPYARLVTTIVFSVVYLLLIVVLAMPSFGPATLYIGAWQVPLANGFPFVFVPVAMFGALLATLHWIIYSQPFDEHLGE